MRHSRACLVVVGLLIAFASTAAAFAGDHSKSSATRTSHSSGTHVSTVSPCTGSKTSSERVSGYSKKNGTHVDSYRKSTADKSFNNNWSTKGNVNLATGKAGTKVTPPKK